MAFEQADFIPGTLSFTVVQAARQYWSQSLECLGASQRPLLR